MVKYIKRNNMNTINKFFIVLLLGLSGITATYAMPDNEPDGKGKQENTGAVQDEGALLRQFILKSGNYINSTGIPNMVSAEDVFENLADYLVIDVRSKQEYVDGHINGAVHLKASEIMDYLDTKTAASAYDKVVIACHTGQTASYITSALRLAGYNNVYAMKFGMSAWNRKLDKWSKNVSGKYSGRLETKANPKAPKGKFPVIKTGEKGAAEILRARVKEVLNTPFPTVKVKADEVFANPSAYYIINYWPEKNYLKGHIPTATQYTPKKDLSVDAALNTLPTDKKVVVYCYTGQNAAFTVAYLRVLGYDAYTIPFGANGFMYDKVVANGWHAFKAAEKLNDFFLIKGDKPMGKDFTKQIIQVGNAPKKKKTIIRRKKKEVAGGCG